MPFWRGKGLFEPLYQVYSRTPPLVFWRDLRSFHLEQLSISFQMFSQLYDFVSFLPPCGLFGEHASLPTYGLPSFSLQ